MRFAVIQTGGKQYGASEGDSVAVEKISGPHKKGLPSVALAKEGDKIVFDKVLLVETGGDTIIGAPYVIGARVLGVLEKIGRRKKIDVIKYKPKVRYFKKYGHRQPYFRVRIEKIEMSEPLTAFTVETRRSPKGFEDKSRASENEILNSKSGAGE